MLGIQQIENIVGNKVWYIKRVNFERLSSNHSVTDDDMDLSKQLGRKIKKPIYQRKGNNKFLYDISFSFLFFSFNFFDEVHT